MHTCEKKGRLLTAECGCRVCFVGGCGERGALLGAMWRVDGVASATGAIVSSPWRCWGRTELLSARCDCGDVVEQH